MYRKTIPQHNKRYAEKTPNQHHTKMGKIEFLSKCGIKQGCPLSALFSVL